MEIIVYVCIWIFIWVVIWQYRSIMFTKYQRRQAINQSTSVILWHVHEKLAPIHAKFPYHPKDCVFIGKWIDYIIFDWLGEGIIKNIIFLEVKTWRSQLNVNEKLIQQAISSNRVRYDIMRID